MTRRLLVTDLGNTLWDWFIAWHQSFTALLDRLVETAGADWDELIGQIRQVHQLHGGIEYPNLVYEVSALTAAGLPSCSLSPSGPSNRTARTRPASTHTSATDSAGSSTPCTHPATRRRRTEEPALVRRHRFTDILPLFGISSWRHCRAGQVRFWPCIDPHNHIDCPHLHAHPRA